MTTIDQAAFDELKANGRVHLAGCVVRGVVAIGHDFSSCQLNDATLEDCDFTGADFHGANLGQVTAKRCSFEGAYLGKSEWYRAVVEDCSFVIANAPRVELLYTRFLGCKLQDLDAEYAELEETEFEACDLTGAIFFGADVRTTKVRRCEPPQPFEHDDDFIVTTIPRFKASWLRPSLLDEHFEPRENVFANALMPAVQLLRDAPNDEVRQIHAALVTMVNGREASAAARTFPPGQRAALADALYRSAYTQPGKLFVNVLNEVLEAPVDVFGLEQFVERVVNRHAQTVLPKPA